MTSLGRFGWGQLKEFMARSNGALYGDLPRGTDISGAADTLGRQQLAEQLSGTTDRGSRKYKNARDYISRHMRGSRRTVKPEFNERVSRALRESRRSEIRERGGLQVEITADVRVSGKVWKRGHMRSNLTGSDLDEYLDALERGDGNEAMSIFLDNYGIRRDVAEIPAIHNVSYT